MKKYFVYHLHSTYSKMDSTIQPEQCVNRMVELGHTAVCFTEHGNVSNYIKKKQLADIAKLKYVHGVELYLTATLEEKIRDNYHVVLLAKNKNGVDELNELITMASDEKHMYYHPRISFDEFFNMSSNIIAISACLGGVLNKIEPNTELFNKFVNRFDFLEIQHHNVEEQKKYNIMLSKLGKPLIAGTDTHELTQYGAECRKILMKGKGQSYGDEDSFDLTLKTYEELITAYKIQNSLDMETIIEAIENTNKLEDMIEDFQLDYTFKYPSEYKDEESLIRKIVYENLKNENIKDDKIKLYTDRIEDEITSFNKVGMIGFMLYMNEIIEFCISNSIQYGPGRGSCTGSLVAYLLKITDVDPIIWGTNFSRFVNDSRVSLGDIDVDFSPEDRIRVYNYIRKKSGDNKSSYIGTFGRLSTKSIIDNVGRAINKPLNEVAEIKKGYEIIEKKDKLIDRIYESGGMDDEEYEIRKEEIRDETSKYISKFDDIFYYYNGLNGVIVSEGKHACGMISSPVDIRSGIGLRFDKNNDCWVSQCDMKNVDSVNFVKFDILSLKTLQVIKHTYKLLNKKVPRANEINWNDDAVYESMLKSNIGLFQMESKSSFEHMKKFAPKNLKEISLVNAFVRPSCDSFRNEIINRKFNKCPSDTIGNILSESYGFLTYQEQIISFLQQACGFSGQDADSVRKCIGKKDMRGLEGWIPKIQSGYVKNSDKEESVAIEECIEFIKVMKDAGFYSFSYNHSIAYSMITYMTAYLRHYHPVEFICSYLNNASDDGDIIDGSKLASILGIKIYPAKYGKSRASYVVEDGAIYKGVESIINLSALFAEELFDISNNCNCKTFPEIIDAIYLHSKAKNTTKIETLIRVNYFSDYGKRKKLYTYFMLYQTYGKSKALNKEKINGAIKSVADECGFVQTEKQYKVDAKVLMDALWNKLKDQDFTTQEILIDELSFLNYIESDIPQKDKIGTVVWAGNTKRGRSVLVGNRWFSISDELKLPTKGEVIMFELVKSTIVKYDVLELKRNKR